jgi:fucose permease
MGASVFLSQYFQIARGKSPTVSGLMTLPMIGGLVIASTVVGKLITATGLWKRYLVMGSVSLTVGLCLMATARADTNPWMLGGYMFVLGMGIGALQQNLVLAVQNAVPVHQLGAASSVVAFFRSLGGAVGVSALGAVMASKVTGYLADGGLRSGGGSGSGIPDVRHLPEPARTIVEGSYGHAVGDIFLFAAPFGLIALIAVLLIKEVPLQTAQAVVVAKAEPSPPTDESVSVSASSSSPQRADKVSVDEAGGARRSCRTARAASRSGGRPRRVSVLVEAAARLLAEQARVHHAQQ